MLVETEAFKLGCTVESLPVASFWSSAALRYVHFIFKIALDSDPNDAAVLIDFADFLALSGEDVVAQRAFLLVRAVSANPKNAKALENLSICLLQLNMTREYEILQNFKARIAGR